MTTRISLEDFLRDPDEIEWQRELSWGWKGPDGSSNSTDDIQGIRIGRKSRQYRYHRLPANLHDWRYRLGRRMRLPEEYRKAADQGYRDGCLQATAILMGWSGWKARMQCRIRYRALRWFAGYAWRGRA